MPFGLQQSRQEHAMGIARRGGAHPAMCDDGATGEGTIGIDQ